MSIDTEDPNAPGNPFGEITGRFLQEMAEAVQTSDFVVPPEPDPAPDPPSNEGTFPTFTKPTLSRYEPGEAYFGDGGNYAKLSYEVDAAGTLPYDIQTTVEDESVGPYGISAPPSGEVPLMAQDSSTRYKVRAAGYGDHSGQYGQWSELSDPLT
jgi:hypothetical protein